MTDLCTHCGHQLGNDTGPNCAECGEPKEGLLAAAERVVGEGGLRSPSRFDAFTPKEQGTLIMGLVSGAIMQLMDPDSTRQALAEFMVTIIPLVEEIGESLSPGTDPIDPELYAKIKALAAEGEQEGVQS